MTKNRLEAFSDGVIAIIVTIMVLELNVPEGYTWAALSAILPHLETYILSFVLVLIYWNNHHHLLHAARVINGRVLLANGHLLFWLSLMPFTTAWLGNHFAALPVAAFGFVLLMSGVAYYVLTQSLLRIHAKNSMLAKAIGSDKKGFISLIVYGVAIIFAFISPVVSIGLYIAVAILWIIPDRRIEDLFEEITE